MHVESRRLSDLITLVISKLGHVIFCEVKLPSLSLFQTSDSHKTTCYIMQFKFECSAIASSDLLGYIKSLCSVEPRLRKFHYVTEGRITASAERELIWGSGGFATLKLTIFHKMRGKFCIETCIKFV